MRKERQLLPLIIAAAIIILIALAWIGPLFSTQGLGEPDIYQEIINKWYEGAGMQQQRPS